MKKLCKSKICYLVAQGNKTVNSSKNGRFSCDMIGETQPEMELLEVVAFICPFSLEAVSTMPPATRILFSFTASLDLMRSSKLFLQESPSSAYAFTASWFNKLLKLEFGEQ